MNKIIVLLLVLVVFAFNSCEDKNEDELKMQYLETKCANPWDALPEQGDYLTKVYGYLQENGITVISHTVEIYDENAGANCEECSCPTGRYVVIRIPVKDGNTAEAIGFTLVE